MDIQSVYTETSGVKLAKMMLESKRLMQEEALIEYKSNPAIKEAVEKLKKRNEQRGTPIISA
ncbi:MAG: hypothetical protein U5M51_02635 [Emticicia sp.]|nr:hypothetical protein [Emticicia sp.]